MAYLRVFVGLGISAACVALLLTQIDLHQTGAALGRAQPFWIVVGVFVLLVAMVAKAIRWGVLFYPVEGLQLKNLFSALSIGYMILSVVPMRLGELVRAYLIGRTEPVTFTQSVGTILVEKVLDVLTILAFLAVMGLFVQLPEMAVPNWVLAAIGLGGVGVLVVLAWLPRRQIVHVLARLQLALPGSPRFNLVKIVGPFLDALAILRYPKLLPPIIGWSLVNWTLAAVLNYVGFLALGIEAPVAAAIWLMVVTNLAMILPSAPGYVGVYHSFTVLALSAFAIDRNLAAGYAIVMHALVYGTFILVGLFFVWRGGYRWSDLWPGHGAAAKQNANGHRPAVAGTAVADEPLVVAASSSRRS
jgi:hypothetical protein